MHVVHLIGYLGKNPEHKSVKGSDRKYAVRLPHVISFQP
jgi:hypothetical protein